MKKIILIIGIIGILLISGCDEKEPLKIDSRFCDLDYWRMCNETIDGEIKCEGDEEPFGRMCGFKYTKRDCELCQ